MLINGQRYLRVWTSGKEKTECICEVRANELISVKALYYSDETYIYCITPGSYKGTKTDNVLNTKFTLLSGQDSPV